MKRLFLLILPFAFLSCDSGSTPKGTPDVPGDTPKEEEITGGPDAFLDGVLSRNFSGIVDVKKDGKTYTHLLAMAEEAVAQTKGTSKAGLPLLYQQENFPTAYNYFMGWDVDTAAVYKTMIGWLSAMQLSELCPAKRNALYKAGYAAGGYTMNSNIYGYHFKNDPNVARLVASAVYAAMHTTAKPDIAAMRTEVGGSQFGKTLAALYDDEPRNHVTDDAFYVDLRKFMASAPGPYAPGYTDRSSLNPTFPDDKSSNGCLTMDMSIYFTVTGRYVLPEERTVQAIADEDGDVHHLFGTDKVNIDGQYDIKAVFGAKTIGESIDPEGKLPQMIDLMFKTGSSARGILQHADASLGGIEYGRLRPGCSEEKEGQRKSYYDDRLNVLTCFAIEDNDGHKTTYDDGDVEVYYYDENGEWTNAWVQSEEDYEEMAKDLLYANSYPSGHAAGIWSAAMSMIELYPQKADLIMKAANDFATSRVISRYHWNSDIIQGRVIGSIMNPVCHAASDYISLLDAARTEVRQR